MIINCLDEKALYKPYYEKDLTAIPGIFTTKKPKDCRYVEYENEKNSIEELLMRIDEIFGKE